MSEIQVGLKGPTDMNIPFSSMAIECLLFFAGCGTRLSVKAKDIRTGDLRDHGKGEIAPHTTSFNTEG